MSATAAERVLQHMQHLLGKDEESDRLLSALVTGHAQPLERLFLAAYGDDDRTPLAVLIDPACAELWSLASAAQWTGGTPPAQVTGESDVDYLTRARAVAAAGPAGQGSAEAIRRVARDYLTGPYDERWTKVVERAADDGWTHLLITRTAQTPDPVALEAAVNDISVIPSGQKVQLQVSDDVLIEEMTRAIDGITVAIDTLTEADVT